MTKEAQATRALELRSGSDEKGTTLGDARRLPLLVFSQQLKLNSKIS